MSDGPSEHGSCVGNTTFSHACMTTDIFASTLLAVDGPRELCVERRLNEGSSPRTLHTVVPHTPYTRCKRCPAAILICRSRGRWGPNYSVDDLFCTWMRRFSSQWFWCSCVRCRMWPLLRTQACLEVQTTSLSRFQTLLRSCALSQSSSASYLLLYATGNLDSQHHVFEFCISVEVTMDVIVSFFCSSGQKQWVQC